MTDKELIARLRELASWEDVVGVMQDFYCGGEMIAAADRIEALTDEVRTLRLVIDANIEKHRSRAEAAEAKLAECVLVGLVNE